jgi:hypothetical protein
MLPDAHLEYELVTVPLVVNPEVLSAMTINPFPLFLIAVSKLCAAAAVIVTVSDVEKPLLKLWLVFTNFVTSLSVL